MSGRACLARRSRTQVVEFVKMTTWIVWWARWILLVGVGCLWLCVTSKQTGARRTLATQTQPDCVYVSQFGECCHGDRKCHRLRTASRVNEKRTCQLCGWPEALNHSAENLRIVSRRQPGSAASWRQSEVLFHRSMSARITMGVREPHREDVRSEQLWKLQATFRAGVMVRTCVAGTRRNIH